MTKAQTELTVRALVEDEALGIAFRVSAGASGLDRLIRHSRIQKSGLALASHFHGIESSRIQVLGLTEVSYLLSLPIGKCQQAVRHFFDRDLCCVILTEGGGKLGEASAAVVALREAADEMETPLLVSPERSSRTISALHTLLDERLAPRQRIHGVLVDVFEVGLLLLGSSGVGKSEVALELIMRGHRLVADDVVDCVYRPPGMVFGAPADLLRYYLEVRGLGILNVKDLFGVTAVRERKRIDVVVQLVEASDHDPGDRLGLDERTHSILDVDVPKLLIGVRPGRDMASIMEIAARNELLKQAGHHPVRDFFSRFDSSSDSEAPPASGGPSTTPSSNLPPVGPRRDFSSRSIATPPPESAISLPIKHRK